MLNDINTYCSTQSDDGRNARTVTVILNGEPIVGKQGENLAELLLPDRPCGGRGICGKCKAIVHGAVSEPCENEKSLLSEDELMSGVRLLCMTKAEGDCSVNTRESNQAQAQIVTDGAALDFISKPSFSKYGVAIDIGTTTLAARLYSATGALLATSAVTNSQQAWGADVITRVESARKGKSSDLFCAIRNDIDSLIESLCAKTKLSARDIEYGVITGNTVMLSLLTQTDTEPFSHAPFAVERLFGEYLTAEKLGISSVSSDVKIYLPSCISAFVGADTTCAILASRICEGNDTMLVDIGTNGEMALFSKGELSVCSTAAGPAFEGVGISMGMRAGSGAIDRVTLKDKKMKAHVIGGGAPVGICGSGLVDAVACLMKCGVLDESGYLENDTETIQDTVSVTQSDIRMLQLAKSAVFAGLVTLVRTQRISFSEIESLAIAGGFGCYLNTENAAVIGLLPKELVKKSLAVGNAALDGASMILLNDDFKQASERIAKRATVIDLATNPVFSEAYMLGMMLGENAGDTIY